MSLQYKPRVYLSGGFKSGWQETVIDALKDKFLFFNPRNHHLGNPDMYTAWDVHFVKECDIIFAYMENSNPSGYGLSFELGIAYALNKTIILVDEKSVLNEDFAKYFRIMHRPSNVVLQNLAEGISFLETFYIPDLT